LPANKAHSRGLPKEFAPRDKSYRLYEEVPYEEFWDGKAQARQDALEKRLVSDMLPVHGKRIIDLGCGYGRLAPCYLDRFDKSVLFDGSMSLLRQAKESIGERAVFIAGDITRLPFTAGSFDSILSIRVLQHMTDLEVAVRGMGRILACDGEMVFSYHNKRNARRVMHYLASRRIDDPFTLESAEVSPTLLSHHPARVAASLEAAGFSEPEYRGAAVVNALASVTELLGGQAPSGLAWATFAGAHRLAPWLIGRTQLTGGAHLLAERSIDDLLECPACRGDITRHDDSFECPACGKRYPVVEGILDFRI